MRKVGILLLFFVSLFAENYQEIRVNNTSVEVVHRLQDLGVDLDHVKQKKGEFIQFAIPANLASILSEDGIAFQIIHEDLEAYYASRLYNISSRDFDYGSMGGYYTHDEVVEHLIELSEDYPHVVSELQYLGESHEGRPIYAVKLSDNPNVDEDEPEVLYTGLHHAREPMSYMNLFYYMYWLAQNYNIDDEATALLNNREMWFIPMVNPDGLVYNEGINSNGGGMQRKNHRETCSSNDDQYDWDGIDLNRNYSYQWAFDNNGSSPDPCSQTYRGTEPFSEPETQIVRDFVESHDFPIVLNYHSYGNLLIHPLGYIAGLLPPEPDLSVFREFGDEMTMYNNYLMGTGIETVGYTVNGEACDWMYGEHGIYAYTPEIGLWSDGFWPESDRILPLAEENLHPNKFVAWAVGSKYKVNMDFEEDFYIQGESYSFDYNIKNQGLANSNGAVAIKLESSIFEDEEIIITDLNSWGIYSNSKSFSIPSNTSGGSIFPVTISVNDDIGFIFSETYNVLVGQPDLLFSDDAENGMTNWSTDGWGLSQNEFAGNYAFSDSPQGDYVGDWGTSHMTLNSPIDFSEVGDGYLQITAKWAIEEAWDWAQVLGSTDGQNWTSLQGNFMSGGAGQGIQTSGEFGYDGESDWVTDNISLAQFAGEEQVYIQFKISSDGHVTDDGIYIDNISIFGYNAANIILGDVNHDGVINVLDIVNIVNIILDGSAGEEDLLVADLNGDGDINILDIVILVGIILQD
ncbi:MAG: immune inhibitor A [Candidatus Marinimicrobia bacterium]|nr:immune inhibitor A [Candidatus Neomarinimicrobiota bacterium]